MKQIWFLALIISIGVSGVAQPYTKFSKQEKKLIKKGEGPMRVWTIYNLEDSILLRKPSFEIKADSSSKKLMRLIDRMHQTILDSATLGVGIAAPQVGVLKRLILVQRFDKVEAPIVAYVNPKIISCSGEKIAGKEGCLSIPGRSETVFRQQDIVVEYDDWNGGKSSETVKGFTSVIFQHEIDHLNGILYLDHLKSD